MKTLKRTIIGLASLAVLFTACNDFEEINKDPNAVDESAIKVSYLLNKSIMGAQQNPHIAERVFVYQWKSAARFERRSGLATGANYNDYNTDYFGVDYGVGWLNNVNMAVKIGTERAAIRSILMRTICYRCLVFGGLMSSLNWLITLVLCLRQTLLMVS